MGVGVDTERSLQNKILARKRQTREALYVHFQNGTCFLGFWTTDVAIERPNAVPPKEALNGSCKVFPRLVPLEALKLKNSGADKEVVVSRMHSDICRHIILWDTLYKQTYLKPPAAVYRTTHHE
jgi:hypothetical protein